MNRARFLVCVAALVAVLVGCTDTRPPAPNSDAPDVVTPSADMTVVRLTEPVSLGNDIVARPLTADFEPGIGAKEALDRSLGGLSSGGDGTLDHTILFLADVHGLSLDVEAYVVLYVGYCPNRFSQIGPTPPSPAPCPETAATVVVLSAKNGRVVTTSFDGSFDVTSLGLS